MAELRAKWAAQEALDVQKNLGKQVLTQEQVNALSDADRCWHFWGLCRKSMANCKQMQQFVRRHMDVTHGFQIFAWGYQCCLHGLGYDKQAKECNLVTSRRIIESYERGVQKSKRSR